MFKFNKIDFYIVTNDAKFQKIRNSNFAILKPDFQKNALVKSFYILYR